MGKKRLKKTKGVLGGSVFEIGRRPTDKDGVGVAKNGTLCVNTATGKVYVNTGKRSAPQWKKVPGAHIPKRNLSANLGAMMMGGPDMGMMGGPNMGMMGGPNPMMGGPNMGMMGGPNPMMCGQKEVCGRVQDCGR